MEDFKNLESFLINARAKTYSGGKGRVKAALANSTQLEYKDANWLYRDIYYTGKNTFYGIETVYYKDKPIFGMSYYGNWGLMTEKEIDDILREALALNPATRLYKKIEWKKGDFIYRCEPDLRGGIKEIGGTEYITRNNNQIYVLYYAGSILTEKV